MVHALEVEGLGVRFGRQPALSGVSFAVPAGETLAVIGPNGSGKTILFKALILAPRVAAQPIGTMSGGQFQRLLLAFALMGRPTVLLFDEPTAGVDEPGEEGLYALIRRLQQSEHMTLLLISHELALVYQHADLVLCLSTAHRPAFLGPPQDVLTPKRLRAAYGTSMKFHVHDDHLT